jgi:ribosome maturation factor RimP
LENRNDQSLEERLVALVSPVVAEQGLDLIGLDHDRTGRHQTVRIFIDKDGGVTVQECTTVARRVAADLDDAEILTGEYKLEVSSPGIDRPLRSPADFRRKLKRRVRVNLNNGDGKKTILEGLIEKVDEESMTVGTTTVSWEQVIEGKLVI